MLKTVEKVLLLQDLPEFRRASTEHLAKLAMLSQERSVPAGTLLFSRGERSFELLLLVKGKVRLEGIDGGPELAEKTALDVFSVLSQSSHVCSARAEDACVILSVSYDDIVDLFEAEAEFCWVIVQYLSHRGRELVIKLSRG